MRATMGARMAYSKKGEMTACVTWLWNKRNHTFKKCKQRNLKNIK